MKPIYTLDTETDPFQFGRIPTPFVCGLYDGSTFRYRWGNDCMAAMREVISHLPPGIIYVHNGGRFDFYYMLDWFDGKINIINSRIIKALGLGHEWRDSAAIYPMPLRSFKKDDIDYSKMEVEVRDKHKKEILEYFEHDCTNLHELVTSFIAEFGDNLTIGGTSMKQLKKLHKFETLTAEQDARLRERFYFGGRVQCFEKGIITPKWSDHLYVYDINQSYPTSMRNYRHPISGPIFRSGAITDSTFFVTVRGTSHGCFPQRTDDGLRFMHGRNIFSCSIHEYIAATETSQFDCEEIIECVDFDQSGTFAEFVDTYHGLRMQAKLNGDALMSDFYKLLCNSAYGKFAQCPDNYFDYVIKPMGEFVNGYDLDYMVGDVCLWRKPSDDVTRYNVATGASITGASRSMLIRALATAKRPIYCDTDSIICEGMGDGIEIDEFKLGAWKLEKYGSKLALAGRKLYALFDANNNPVKMASKGVRIVAHDIERVCNGELVTWRKIAPTFSLSRGTTFMSRDVRMLSN